MDRRHLTRRRYLGRWATGLAAGAGVALAGCSGPEDDGNGSGDGGGDGVY